MKLAILSFIIILFFGFTACKKDTFFSKNNLSFSTDSVLFDTVFTTIGSTTKRFKVYNKSNKPLKIEEIQLMGGADSPFRINFDGLPGLMHKDIEIEGNDSLFCFVEVTLQVNNATNPLVISDSIRFLTNGKNQYVHLDVWGQDAYFHAPAPGNTIVLVGDDIELWKNDKPHVLYGYVAVDSAKTLTIPAGTRVYGHKNSRLLVYKGTLNINGTPGNEVVFQGDRLESFYDNIAGQWRGIHLSAARTCSINHAIIKNAEIGLQVDSTTAAITLNLTNTFIDNSSFYSLLLNSGPIVNAENSVFGSAGIASAFLLAGGTYNFNQCNFVNYWVGGRSGPAFAMQNYFTDGGITYVRSIVASRFDNCIFYGNAANEINVDTLMGFVMDFKFNASVMKREEIYDYPTYTSIIWNKDPRFVDSRDSDFHLLEDSPCRNAADAAYSTALDIEAKPRLTLDIGAYTF